MRCSVRLAMVELVGLALFCSLGAAPRREVNPPATPRAAAAKATALPEWTTVERAVTEQLATNRNWEASFLLSRTEAEGVLDRLAAEGWKVAERDEILERLLPKSDALVSVLHTSSGRQFMRQMRGLPDRYDRLDRLMRMPHGRQTIEALVRGPDGYKMLEYMTTTQGGTNLGKQLSSAPTGRNFNQATKRIYTSAELLAALSDAHQQALKRGESKSPSSTRSTR